MNDPHVPPTPPEKIEKIKAKADRYIEKIVEPSIAYYKRHGCWNRYLYNGSKIVLIVASVSLPAMSAIPADSAPLLLAVLKILLPLAIAILAALDGFFHWGDIWRSRVHTELSLRRSRRQFGTDWDLLQFSGTEEIEPKALEIYRKFFDSVEATFAAEEDQFWRRRVEEQKELRNQRSEETK